jgi:hypothetical protein
VKLVVFADSDPDVAITFAYTTETPGHTRGWHGTCTNCGQTVHSFTEGAAFTTGQTHANTCAQL